MIEITQVYQRFPDREACISHLEGTLWQHRPVCPYCAAGNPSRMPAEQRYHCNRCNRSYSVTVNTVFHKSKVDLQKWFYAFMLLLHTDSDLTSRQLAAALGVNRKTAWFMLHRIRKAVEQGFRL